MFFEKLCNYFDLDNYGQQNRWNEPGPGSFHQRDGSFRQRDPPQQEQPRRGPGARNAWDECNDLFQPRQDEDDLGKKKKTEYHSVSRCSTLKEPLERRNPEESK